MTHFGTVYKLLTNYDTVHTHFKTVHTHFGTIHTLFTNYDTVHTHFDIVHTHFYTLFTRYDALCHSSHTLWRSSHIVHKL